MNRFVFCQRISWTENMCTKITRNGDPSNMIRLDVVHYISHASLLSTHLAYPCSSTVLAVWIGIFTDHHHWFHLLVQIFHICVIGCLICVGKCLFICCLLNFIFNAHNFVHWIFSLSWSVLGRFWLGLLFCWLRKDFCLIFSLVSFQAFQLELVS